MILEHKDLKKYRGKVTMVAGGFDPIHHGHIEYLKTAHELGLPVLCSIDSDFYVSAKHPILLPASMRAEVIGAIRYVSFIYLNNSRTAEVLRELRPKYFLKGKDWDGRLPQDEQEACKKYRIKIVYADTTRDSSTSLVKNYLSRAAGEITKKDLEAFENIFHSQKEVPASHYEDEYFNNDWRKENNSYQVEVRRRVEGKHPALIKKVFKPKKVLDVGCGPGALMYLLKEKAVSCDGVDFSPSCLKLAPLEVRGKIIIGSIVDTDIKSNFYDLVICREVLEHLTLSQIRKAVENLCRISSRYVYLTTRFHQNPASLLSVADDKETDPTHITVLNKDFLRTLFVLEGFRRRADLEDKMDWLKKNRVLVYEKVERLKSP